MKHIGYRYIAAQTEGDLDKNGIHIPDDAIHVPTLWVICLFDIFHVGILS